MRDDVKALMIEASKTTEDVGRLMRSRKGHDKAGFDDIIGSLEHITEAVRIARQLEFNV